MVNPEGDKGHQAVDPGINKDALKSEIRAALINRKANACPMAVRVAWHSAGTFDKTDGTGGSNGSLMRFEPEHSDPANAGLYIIHDMLHEVKKRNPNVSYADLWTLAGSLAVGFTNGPDVKHSFGRVDAPAGTQTPENGRLPDAAQGASHVRDVFSRMGFNDKETVALCGAHTLGRCHIVRSGFDGKWTTNPLKFDNEYFKNLLNLTWQPRKWDGPMQYEDAESGELMMLPTDIALIEDPAYKQHVELYAKDQEAFFQDFADAFSRLLSLGCPEAACPHLNKAASAQPAAPRDAASAEFREAAMHGHAVDVLKKIAKDADVHDLEKSSGRSALHKAAFWGHEGTVCYLIHECGLEKDLQDYNGDTPLHDAVRFGNTKVVEIMLSAGANKNIKNADGHDCISLAKEYNKTAVLELLQK
ncbi:heme peroxidase [Chloropicon primus]|uniref:Heme peroxidase n=1 Tax=Chloropicon primus TaxID=1764295 RepID=A0A5B8MDI9_9CHLO|nr:heme peroxidase [Chloropicon primus]UPQ97425.1 heme peroxidase [Chloropicon primus]|eukprot:QDZ18214.1 heme peroxidase [Chloropicon primus]